LHLRELALALTRVGDKTAARKEGWVTRRATQRREAREKRKAAKEKKLAEGLAVKERDRQDRKLRGEAVTPSPTPSEVAYQRRKAEATRERRATGLRNRVRRTELELLVAAAMGKQCRERTMADHSGYEVRRPESTSSAVKSTPIQTGAEGKRAKTKNGAQTKAKADIVRDMLAPLLGHTPDVSSGTESSDSIRGRKRSKIFKSKGKGKLPGGFAKASFYYDPDAGISEESDTEIENTGVTIDGLGGLGLDDVDDGVLATLHDTLVVPPVEGRDWADTIFAEIISGETTVVPRPTAFQAVPTPSREELVRNALKHFKSSDPLPAGRSRQCEPNRALPADPRLYDARYWLNSTKDNYDATWVRAVLDHTAQTETEAEVETGFITWETQERRFPRLDQRLALQDVSPPNLMIFDPATVDTQVWDPLNRAISEPRTGKRAPLKLNPITTLSLARWTTSEYGGLPSRMPLQLPDNPSIDDKKRPLPSAALAHPRVRKPKSMYPGRHRRESVAQPGTKKPSPVASIHYPLNSPAVTSISESGQYGHSNVAAIGLTPTSESRPKIRPAPPGPPTPYPRLPDTPTVALYPNIVASDGEEDGRERAKAEVKSVPSTKSPVVPRMPTISRKRPASDSVAELSSGVNRPERTERATTYVQPSVADASDNSISESDKRPRRSRSYDNMVQVSGSGDADVNTASNDSIYASNEGKAGSWHTTAEYDVEDLQSVHPSVLREYAEARTELRAVNKANTTEYARAKERFGRAQSQFKAVLKKESTAKEIAAAAAAHDAGNDDDDDDAADEERHRRLRELMGQSSPTTPKKTEKFIPGLSTLYSAPSNSTNVNTTRKRPEKSVRFNIAKNIEDVEKPRSTGPRPRTSDGSGIVGATQRAIRKLALTKRRLQTL